MNKLFTAIGSYKSQANRLGKQYPIVVVGTQEYLPNMHEMIIWTYLNWSILTIQQIEEIYIKKCNDAGLDIVDCAIITERLVRKGMIVSGVGNTDEDALYDLLGELYITIPTDYGMFIKILSYLKLTLVNRVPFRKALALFHKEKYTGDEKRVINLAKQTVLSTAEIIKCVENDAYDVSNDDKMLDVLYGDEYTTCDNIISVAKLYTAQKQVLTAIANLYLRRQIIFQRM